MNCKEVREFLISGDADSKISEDKLSAIGAHLKACRECADIDVRIKNIKGSAERFREILPSDEVWNNVRDEILKKKRDINTIFWRFPALTFAISTAVLFIIFTLFILKNREDENSLYEFVGTQAEFLVSLEMGDTTLYEPLFEDN